MDWLEQWFGIAPDNGDGSLELLIVLTILAAGAVFVIRRRLGSRRMGFAPRNPSFRVRHVADD